MLNCTRTGVLSHLVTSTPVLSTATGRRRAWHILAGPAEIFVCQRWKSLLQNLEKLRWRRQKIDALIVEELLEHHVFCHAERHSKLTTISDLDILGGLAGLGTETLNLLDDLHTFDNLSVKRYLTQQQNSQTNTTNTPCRTCGPKMHSFRKPDSIPLPSGYNSHASACNTEAWLQTHTEPKTTCLPSNHSVLTVHRKN